MLAFYGIQALFVIVPLLLIYGVYRVVRRVRRNRTDTVSADEA